MKPKAPRKQFGVQVQRVDDYVVNAGNVVIKECRSHFFGPKGIGGSDVQLPHEIVPGLATDLQDGYRYDACGGEGERAALCYRETSHNSMRGIFVEG
jgi:hypothetical protein